MVTKESLAGLRLLNQVQGRRHIHYVGSYAFEGIPLLEGCVCSSLNMAERFGVTSERVFGNTPEFESYKSTFWARFFIFFGLLFSWLLDLIL